MAAQRQTPEQQAAALGHAGRIMARLVDDEYADTGAEILAAHDAGVFVPTMIALAAVAAGLSRTVAATAGCDPQEWLTTYLARCRPVDLESSVDVWAGWGWGAD